MHAYHTLLHEESLRDNMLYTLNELQRKHPDLHARAAAKYDNRPHIRNTHIPHLECRWGDAVFLGPVHPDKVLAALAKYCQRSLPACRYYAIPIADLAPENLVIWLYKSQQFEASEVIPFNSTILEQLREVPSATIAYFEEQQAKKETPFWFVHTPHIFYKGSIDISAYPLHSTTPFPLPT